jgi:hypothetical protein
MSDKSGSNAIVDKAWDGAVGGLDWLKSVLFGEFADNRTVSAMIADMLLSFVPGVVIVTSARDAVAVIIRLAQHPENRDDALEWIMLAACMIVIALPLAMAAGGSVAAGVGGVVGGIAGSELGAALRAVMLLLIKDATKLADVLRFLQKFLKGDLVFFLRSIKFAKYEKALVLAFNKTISKLLEVCKNLRSTLEHVRFFNEAKAAIAILSAWESKFYAVQQSAIKQLPKAMTELDKRLAKLLIQVAPKERHNVVAAVRAKKPAAKAVRPQRVHDTIGHPLRTATHAPPKGGRPPPPKTKVKPKPAPRKAKAPPIKAKPSPVKKVNEGSNVKRQETASIDAVVPSGSGSAAKPARAGVASAGASKIPSYAELEELASKTLDFSTQPNAAVFWSGGDNMKLAQWWAELSGKTTIEQTAGGKYLDGLKLFDHMPAADAAKIWDIASVRFADGASGAVNVFNKGASQFGPYGERTWWRLEKPALNANSAVTKIWEWNWTMDPTGLP